MENELSKENIKKLLEIEVKSRGVSLKTDMEFILKEKGEEGLKKLEDELEKLECPIKFKEIKSMEFYPAGLRVISLLAIKKVFNFNENNFRQMGLFATKVSLIIKFFMEYFFSIQKVFFEEAPKIWRKYWTTGEIVPVELNEEKKYGILRLKGIDLHPIFCTFYLAGYFSGILQMLVKTSEITCEEVKCSFRGDKEHEYLIKWK